MTLFPAFDAGFHVGTRVRVIAHYSQLRGLLGTVAGVRPGTTILFVRIDGEPRVLGFEARALEVVSDDAHVTDS